jgi:flagellar biosynthetic protein FliR
VAILEQLLPVFLLVFCRMSSFLVVSPVFSFQNIPAALKIGLAFYISLLVYSALGGWQAPVPQGNYVYLIVQEILIGLLLGFVAYLFFTAVQVAGAFIDHMIGLGMANVVDPLTGAHAPIVGNFKFFIGMLVFLGLNGHHYLLTALMHSYEWVPLDGGVFARIADGSVSTFLLDSLARMFYMAFQMAAPVVVSMFLVDVALGILAKAVPQLHIFVVGLPLKIIVGFGILFLTVSGLTVLFRNLFSEMFRYMEQLLNILSVG